jgi:hypothetical protein
LSTHTVICIKGEDRALVMQNVKRHSSTCHKFSLVFSVFTRATIVRIARTLWYIGTSSLLRLRSSEMWRRVFRYLGKNISEELAASNFRQEIYATTLFSTLKMTASCSSETLVPINQRTSNHIPITRQCLNTSLGLWDLLLERRFLELERRWASSALSAAIWQERFSIRCRSRAATLDISAGTELSIVCIVFLSEAATWDCRYLMRQARTKLRKVISGARKTHIAGLMRIPYLWCLSKRARKCHSCSSRDQERTRMSSK